MMLTQPAIMKLALQQAQMSRSTKPRGALGGPSRVQAQLLQEAQLRRSQGGMQRGPRWRPGMPHDNWGNHAGHGAPMPGDRSPRPPIAHAPWRPYEPRPMRPPVGRPVRPPQANPDRRYQIMDLGRPRVGHSRY